MLENTLEITLEKKLSGLGFTFLISDISPKEGSVVRIRKLFSGQSSEESSPLREGDVILMVNGESVKGLSYQVLCSYTPLIHILWQSSHHMFKYFNDDELHHTVSGRESE